MKQTKMTIALLAVLCVLFALISLFLPDRNGMALSHLTISLACAVSALCIYELVRLLIPSK